MIDHLTALTPVPARHLIEPGALLDDLHLDELDRQTLALDIEDATGREVPERVWRAWNTVGDVVEMVA